MNEDKLTEILVDQLRHGGIKKLTRTTRHAEFNREIGDNSFRTDIFITLSKESVVSSGAFNRKGTHFIAIEVKIRDWMQGLYQAWKYNAFAEKSYLALYRKYAKNVDLNLFRAYNVGLIIFDETSIEVANRPSSNKCSDDYSRDLQNRLWRKLGAVKGAQPVI